MSLNFSVRLRSVPSAVIVLAGIVPCESKAKLYETRTEAYTKLNRRIR